MPFADTPETPEEVLRGKLTALVDNALDRMIDETGNIEPGLLSLVADATAAIAALDARKQSKEAPGCTERPRGSRVAADPE